ncbi:MULTISPECIES: hypothetical protein [unclassified Sphingobium]|uniref:hypothetical protein n=1 Tax=unclassified Sphingobium TaxID=2611147 RepID=UPI00222426C3|nr:MULTISPECIES: hypothetical protein [unclassified Sphingobium]MCW2383128.1 hypothetical protein [Sphingobium sp. B2D3B]MCW2399896.1 hypothetical protein [Sphingobium sp. B2D3C]
MISKSVAAVSAFIIVAAGLSGVAQAQGSLNDQLATCARIGSTEARLACYDSVAQYNQPQGGASSPAPVPGTAGSVSASRTPTPAPAAPAATTGFGAEQVERATRQPRASQEDKETSATLASVREIGPGLWQVTLADGAVWRMTERMTAFQPPAPQDSVTIRKGALGSYLMQVGRQAAVRVNRVR